MLSSACSRNNSSKLIVLLWIPGNLAYGDTPKRPGAPAGTLVFDVELLEIEKALSPEEAKKQFDAFLKHITAGGTKVCDFLISST